LKTADESADDSPLKKPSGLYTVQDAIEAYLSSFEGKSLYQTRRAAELHILKSKLAERPLVELTTEEINRWHRNISKAKPRARSATVDRYRPTDGKDPKETERRRRASSNRTLTILKAALNRAFKHGYVDDDLAWKRVKSFEGVNKPKIRFLTELQCRQLLNSCPTDFRDLVLGALLSGARYGELREMRAEDYDPVLEKVYIRAPKEGDPRFVPLTQEGLDLMDRLTAGRKESDYMFVRADGKVWKSTEQVRRMQSASMLARISPSATFHEIRHSYASLLINKGATLEIIAAALGHSSINTTKKHYAHLLDDTVAKEIRDRLPTFSDKQPKVRRMKR